MVEALKDINAIKSVEPDKSVSVPKERLSLEAPTEKTKGEQYYDYLLYGGVGYFLNFVLSVIGGHFFLKGKGKDAYKWGRDKLYESFKPIFSEKYGEKIAHEAVRILCLGAGGHLVMLPIKWMEDNKRRAVYAINRRFFPEEYGENVELKPASKLKEDELPELVESPAHMSWTKTLVRRMVIFFGIAFSLAPFAKINAKLESGLKNTIHTGVDFVGTSTGSQSIKSFNNSKTFNDYLEVGTSDIYVSAIAAVLVKFTNGAHGMFSVLKGKKPKSTAATTKPASVELAAPVVNSSNPSNSEHTEVVKSFAAAHSKTKRQSTPSVNHIDALEKQQVAETSLTPAI